MFSVLIMAVDSNIIIMVTYYILTVHVQPTSYQWLAWKLCLVHNTTLSIRTGIIFWETTTIISLVWHCIFVFFTCYATSPYFCDFRCQDYIQIDTGEPEKIEICGNIDSLSKSQQKMLLFTQNHLTVLFRTSEEVVDSGFRMAVLCLDQADIQGMMDNLCLIPLSIVVHCHNYSSRNLAALCVYAISFFSANTRPSR